MLYWGTRVRIRSPPAGLCGYKRFGFFFEPNFAFRIFLKILILKKVKMIFTVEKNNWRHKRDGGSVV
jgi:hypothetical protein